MSDGNKRLGQTGEETAVVHLKRNGFRILERNYRSALGELDIVARKGEGIHFIEVKTRRSDASGDPLEQVTDRKQRQIARTALGYCAAKKLRDPEIHFDVVGIDLSGESPVVEHMIDAFESPDSWPYI